MGGHPKLAVAVGPHDHVLGDSLAPLTLVQYGDYTCPYTRRASANVALARRKLGKRVRYVFRHFPREDLNAESMLLPRRPMRRRAGQVLGDAPAAPRHRRGAGGNRRARR
jgi:hypothetical protein